MGQNENGIASYGWDIWIRSSVICQLDRCALITDGVFSFTIGKRCRRQPHRPYSLNSDHIQGQEREHERLSKKIHSEIICWTSGDLGHLTLYV